MAEDYDFSGWATKNDITCSDGRIIRRNAFRDDNGKAVPLVWDHRRDSPYNVLGQAVLEHRDKGVYFYGYFNGTESGQTAKMLVEHGDIKAVSIAASGLREQGSEVTHGVIREVSLVYGGANPGAFIDHVIKHGDGAEEEDELIIRCAEPLELKHSDSEKNLDPEPESESSPGESEEPNKPDEVDEAVESGETGESNELAHSDDSSEEENSEQQESVKDIYNSMNEKQKNVLYTMVGMALGEGIESEEDEDEEGGDITMKHNVFDHEEQQGNTILTHSDEVEILKLARNNTVGSLQTALSRYMEDHAELQHGIESIETLFPEYKDVRPGAPEMLTTDQGWIGKVLQKVHKSPISRIRTRQADLRDISKLRAQGYKKGTEKKYVGDFKLLHRTTDPQTVYVKSKIDRDDILDVVDFDVVQYLYNIDRMNLNEELATAILIGDGREVGDDGKIAEDKIRPVWQDDDLYTIHVDVDYEKMKKELNGTNTSANFGENYIRAEAMIQSLLYAREQYKGSGMPDFYCDPHMVNVMLLARDLNGRRIYDNVSELAAALNVREIITVEQFAGRKRTDKDQKKHKLLGLMVNLADYYVGATKGGEITHFTDFDIDFNQEKSLLETRVSGANTRVLSAIALEEPVAGE